MKKIISFIDTYIQTDCQINISSEVISKCLPEHNIITAMGNLPIML